MKIAPMIFCAALALFLTTLAATKRETNEKSTTEIPFNIDGIDTVEIRSNQTIDVNITDVAAPHVSYQNFYFGNENEKNKVSFSRQDTKLLVTADIKSYGSVEINLPASFHHLIVENAEVKSRAGHQRMDVQASGSFSWSGDAESLSISDKSAHRHCKCAARITIDNGHIEQLYIETLKGRVSLDASEELKAATLVLGTDASLSVSQFGSFKTIKLEEFPADKSMTDDSKK